MKYQTAMGISMLAGIGLGALAFKGLYVQAKAPILAVVDISWINDPEAYTKGIGQLTDSDMPILKYGGRYIATTEKITALDGTPPKYTAIIAFDSVENAQAWYNSPEQRNISEVRKKNTISRVFIVEPTK